MSEENRLWAKQSECTTINALSMSACSWLYTGFAGAGDACAEP